MSVRGGRVEEVGTPHGDFTFFMVRTCCEKKEQRQEDVHVHMRAGASPSRGHIYITGCCMFLLNTFPARKLP